MVTEKQAAMDRLGKLTQKPKTIKQYTITTRRPTEASDSTTIVFTNLRLARIFGREQYKRNNFVSLLNYKLVPLSL
jgi:hypothetical protein